VEPFGHYYVHSSNTAPEVHAALYDGYARSAGITLRAVRSTGDAGSGKAADYFGQWVGGAEVSPEPMLFSITNELCWHDLEHDQLYTPNELRAFGRHYMEALAAMLTRRME
jgi:hypothetical protein